MRGRISVAPARTRAARAVDAEAQRLERGLEERVLLEAVAPAPGADELRLEGGEVEVDRAAEQDVEVLERDRRAVRAVERDEPLEARGERAPLADPREVGVEIQVARHGPQDTMPAP